MKRLALALAAAFMLGGCQQSSSGPGDCGAAPSRLAGLDETWGPTQSIFVLRNGGRLELGTFQGQDWRVLGDHAFEQNSAHGRISPDERWLIVEGVTSAREKQVWLYDTGNTTGRLLLRRTGFGESLPHIAPDGHAIAVFVNPGYESPDLDASGLYLFDSETGRETRLGFPPGRDPSRSRSTLRWAADSRSLYLFVTFENDRPIYQVFPEQGRFEQIEAEYNHDPWNSELRIAGEIVPIQPKMLLPSRYEQDPITSSDGSWTGAIDAGTHELRVAKSGSEARTIATGTPTECGDGLSIRGWVGHYLLYDEEGVPHLHDAEQNRSRQLLEPGDEYFWFGAPKYRER
jgi:hypothetical protein